MGGGGEQRDGVVVALAHLAAIEAWQEGHRFFDHGFGQHEMLAIQMVEARRHVARHLDVLDLVAAHGHLVRLEHQDVGPHQHGIHEQARRHIAVRVMACGVVFVDCRFVGVGTVEHALASHAGEQPGEFGDFRNVGLAVEGDFVRVQARGDPARSDFERGALDAGGLVALDERVVIGQKVKTIGAGVAAGLHRGADGAHVVAQVGGACGGDAGEDAGAGFGVHEKSRRGMISATEFIATERPVD